MEYLKICEVAKKWGLSERGVQSLCAKGKIEGASRIVSEKSGLSRAEFAAIL